MGDDGVIDLSPLAELPGNLPDCVRHVANGIDILLDLLDGAQLEAGVPVGMAEGTLVPGAIPGRPDQETPRLAGRPYGSLLKAGIHGHGFVFPVLGFIADMSFTYFSIGIATPFVNCTRYGNSPCTLFPTPYTLVPVFQGRKNCGLRALFLSLISK